MKKIYKPFNAARLLARLFFVALILDFTHVNAQSFTQDDIAVLVTASSTVTSNTTGSIVELNTFSAGQAGINHAITDGANAANGLRFSGSATSTGYLANSNDGTLLCFTGANSNNTTANVNTLNPRGVATFNSSGGYTLQTTYTGTSGNQTRCATSLNNTAWYIGDQGGLYTNGSTSASPAGNLRGVKSFGGVVFVGQQSSTATVIQVSTVSAISGGTITGLPGLTNGAAFQDFYLIASGANGSTYDMLYIISSTSGTAGSISKFSLVSGSWASNGTYTTSFGGFGIAAKKNGAGADIFVSTGTGASTNNSVIKLNDAAGYNSTINITTGNNIILYTATGNAIIKGVAFAPVSENPTVNLSVNTNIASEADQTEVTVTATASSAVTGDQTVSLGVSGTGITTGDYSIPSATITIPNGSTTGSVTFTVVDDNEFEGQETATLTISNPSAGIILGSTVSQNITITDNDPSPAPTVSLSVSTNSASEASPAAITVTATASSAVSGDQTVSLGVSGTGITFGDYTLSNTTITIPNGSTTGSETFTIVDDNVYEGIETATLTISNPSAGIILGSPVSQNITIADNDFVKIHDIQGSGSTFNTSFGGTQTIQGIVIGSFLGPTKLRGFYVQEEDADDDSDPNTSEGIFIFDPNGLFSGPVGTKVTVTGNVSEFTTSSANIVGTGNSSLTEITATVVTEMGTSTLPSVTNVVLPVNDFTDLEKYEGMLVNVSSASGPLTVTETFKIGRFGQVGLSGGAPLVQYTQVNAPSVSGYANYLANLQDNYIILDDGSTTQNPDPEIFARGGLPLTASNTLRGGDNVASITGILDHRFEGYRVQTTTPVNFIAANARESSAPSVGGNYKLGFFNVLNYFTDLDQGTTISIPDGVSFEPRGANTATEFTRQRDKIISAISTINADVIGVSEIENDGTKSIQDLVNGLNAGGSTYTFINDQNLVNDPNPATNAVGTDAIKVALIYKPAVLTPVGAPFTYEESTPSTPIFSRPPVAQTFITNDGIKFTVIVNHFKSKSSANSLPGDEDQGDGQSLSNATRVAQAQALLSFINTVKTTSGDDKVLVIGDLNSYALEDPITTLTNGGLTNLFPNTTYSYQFNGQWGALDHALATSALSSHITGEAKWHINADEPVVLDYNTEFKSAGQITSFYNADAFRSSDHDPVIVGLELIPNAVSLSVSANSASETGTTSVTVTASTSAPVSGDQTVDLNVSGTGITAGDYNLSNTTITIPDGASSGAVTFTIVNDGVLEGNETAILTLSNPSAGITLGSIVSQDVVIADKESNIDLCNYVRIGRYDLPEPTRTTPPPNSLLAQEASAVTYNWDTNTLFVVGDGGTSIVQVSKTGQLINSMTLAPGNSPQGTEFYDTEGLTYIGNGRFVMMEERDRQAVLFTYVPGTTLTRADTKTVKLGTFVPNIGIEGISFDPLTNGYICVKETQPEGIFQTGIDFDAGTATNGSPTTENSINLFDPALAGLADFADVFALSNLPVLSGQPNAGNLLVLSQESGKIVNIDRSGNISSSLTIISDPGNPLSVANQQHEGLTMDRDGILYTVSENGGGDFDHPQLWVYAPSTVPNQAPTAIVLNNAVTSIAENTSTTAHIKVADINVTDDGLRCNNNISLSGPDADSFEVVGTELFIKAGTVIDYETKNSYSITVNVDDPTIGGAVDATTNYTLAITDVPIENPPGVTMIISEVAPWSSGNSPVAADWFELTNTGTNAVNIAGWKMDDNSNSFASAVALNGITTIAPGESVIFLESASPATTVPAFLSNWFGANPPAGLQVGTYTGDGVGLSTSGDGVSIFNASGELQARVAFGTSPAGPSFPTFNNAIGINNDSIPTLSIVGVNDAFAAVNDTKEIGSPGSIGRIYITEVAPWSSGNSPIAADWFELTNTKATPADITGWKMDDNSGSFAAAVALNGITSIAPGKSVIFIETDAPATTIPVFQNTWFGANLPAGLQIGSYTGSGVGLGTSSDEVNIYDSTGKLQSRVLFGSSPTGIFKTFDNAAKLNNTTISQLSAVGVNGAFIARNDTNEIGSPGAIVSPPCPTISVTPTVTTPISCNNDTAVITVTVNGGTAPYRGTGEFSRTAGTYTFTVTDAYGCTGSQTITIDPALPLSAPVIGVITQPICSVPTGSVVLSGLPSGNWTITRNPGGATTGSGSSTTISGLVPGTYTFTVTSDQGCTSSASDNVVINTANNCGPVDPNKCYVILNRKSGKALTIANGKLNNGAALVQKLFNNESDQKFKFTDAGDGYYIITAQHSGNVIAVKQCSSDQNASLVQQTYKGTDCQKWSLTKLNKYYIIKNKKSGKVIAILDENNNQIVQQTEKDNSRQQWSLVEVSCSAPFASVNTGSSSAADGKLKVDGVLDAKVFPNPAPQQFTVVISATDKQSIQLIIRDNLGRAVETRKNIIANVSITLGGNYRGGVYYLEVIQGDKRIVRKIIKL